MGSKTRLNTFYTKRYENPANLVTSRKINTRLARPIRTTMKRNHVTSRIKVNRNHGGQKRQRDVFTAAIDYRFWLLICESKRRKCGELENVIV